MALKVTHPKINTIPDFTQADLNAQIALGNYPPGTTLSNIPLASDWNNDHTVSGTLDAAQNNVSVDGVTITGNGTPANPLVAAGGGSGNVVGPASATDNAIVRYDTTTGKLIQNSLILIDDVGGITFPGEATPAYRARTMTFDTTNQAWTAYTDDSDVALQVGRENWTRAINNTGSSIANGVPVYIISAASGLPTIALASASAINTASSIGLTTEVIANGATGEVTNFGLVRNVNTAAFALGPVYLSATAGVLTQTVPAAPNFRVKIGDVISVNATTGVIDVTPYTPVVQSVATLITGRTIAMTGDVAWTSGSFNGSANVTGTSTLATVNANVGSFGSASSVMTQTVNAKGLTTAAASVAIQIAESQVTNLVTDLAAKQGTITLTTTGTSGAATLIGNTLNIPNYTTGGGGTGTVTSVSVVTANGVSGSVATATTTPAITLTLGAITPSSVVASGSVTGSNLSGTNTGDQTITLTGQATGSGTGSFAVTLDNASVIGKVLTGYASSPGTVAATDTILAAIGKLNGNDAQKQNLVTLTTTGSGAATFNQGTGALNIPTPTGTVSSVSVVTANGFSGTVATATTTPAITLTTSVTGLLKGNGTAISAATTGTDYSAGTSALATGILKSTTTTGALTIAVAADFPTLNQSTTGNAATVTTNANLTGPITSVGNATSIASSVALPGSPTTTTQASTDNSTSIATTAFVVAAVPGIISAIAAGGVGTYALALKNTPGSVSNFGSTIAGSQLVPTSVVGGSGTTTSLTGTWRCMGYATGAGSSTASDTLWQRTV